jgi:hypothetical protein
MKITKLLIFAILASYLVVLTMCMSTGGHLKMNTSFGNKKSHKAAPEKTKTNDDPLNQKTAPKNLTADDLPNMPVYFEGWLKYFHFLPNGVQTAKSKPRYFFENEAFSQQTSQVDAKEAAADKSKDDQFGSWLIPNNSTFWAVAHRDNLNFIASRDKAFLKVTDSLKIQLIHNIPDDANFKGGVKDLGKFSEGYCFTVTTTDPIDFFTMTLSEPVPQKGTEKVWYVCSDNEEIKNKFMNLVVKLRLKAQHEVGLWLRINNPPKKKLMSDSVHPKIGNLDPTSPAGEKVNGFWVLLQDWSSCTKKCGGGLQYMQLMCSPPRNGGTPCDGEALRTKKCNDQDCPGVSEAKQVLPKAKGKNYGKPIVKVMPISTRPLRYDKCHIKEIDAIFTKWDKVTGFNGYNKFPTRVVMNEKTITMFTDETMATMLGTFVIKNTELFQSNTKPTSCFVLNSDTIKGEFCNIDAANKFDFVAEWRYDFNLFRNQCHTDRKTVALSDKEENGLKKELQDRINGAKLEVVKERANKIKKKIEEPDIRRVDALQQTTLLAMKKELNIDELLQKEESAKESEESANSISEIEKEKKKNDCLVANIAEREIEDQYTVLKGQQDKELKAMKQQSQKQVLAKRNNVKLKIIKMRKKQQRKTKELTAQIQVMRTKVAGDLAKWNKAGDIGQCFKNTGSKDDQGKVDSYCANHLTEAPPSKLQECRSEENFCYVCCETEFGDMHVKEREKCYDKCEFVPDEDKKPAGFWQWVEPVNQ